MNNEPVGLDALGGAARGDADRAKSDLLALLSHELRTPITSLLGWLALLRSGSLDAAGERQALDVIQRSADLQLCIIENLLDLSAIVTGRLQVDEESVDLGAALEAAVQSVRGSAESKGVRVGADALPPLQVRGDARRLQQVFWNLLSNAVKFNRKGGKAWARARAENGWAEVTVEDDGEGLDPDFVPHLFEMFRQHEPTMTRRHGGMGVGLAIARKLVERQGGTLDAASPGPGLGSTFRVRLPLLAAVTAPPAAAPAPPAAARPGRLHGVRILLVDDEPDNLLVMGELLRRQGAEIVPALSAEEALKAFSQETVHIIVSDVMMPHQDGLDLMRKLRAQGSRGAQVPAIALTAWSASRRGEILDAGFQEYVGKPPSVDLLVATIAKLAGVEKS